MGRAGVFAVAAVGAMAALAAGGGGPAAPAAPRSPGLRRPPSPARCTVSPRRVRRASAARSTRRGCTRARRATRSARGRGAHAARPGGRPNREAEPLHQGPRDRRRAALQLPALPLAATVAVGRGAGAPAVGAGSIWIPNTADGTLSRVDATTQRRHRHDPLRPTAVSSATSTTRPRSATAPCGSRATSTPPSPASTRPRTRWSPRSPWLPGPPRSLRRATPWWVAHFLQDVATQDRPGDERARQAPGRRRVAHGRRRRRLHGLAAREPAADARPPRLAALHEIAHADVTPTTRSFRNIPGRLVGRRRRGRRLGHAPEPGRRHAHRSGVGRRHRDRAGRAGRLFGVAAGGGSVWAVTDEALVRIDPATNKAAARAAFAKGTLDRLHRGREPGTGPSGRRTTTAASCTA